MSFKEKIILGKTGLKAGRLGISSSFGAPPDAFEEAFERGCNYFTWGTFIKGRSSRMKEAILHIIKRGKREDLIISMLSYAHNAALTEHFLKKGLKALNIDYTDILLLGYFSKRPSQKLIDDALKLKEKGLIRHIGLTGHKRKLFTELLKENLFDIFHVRFNAVNRGAETEIFPFLNKETSPGIVTFTATRWSRLINPKKIPSRERTPTAADCYRFVLSNPAVNVCMMGAKNTIQMRENLSVLELNPMSEDELKWMQKIGDHLYKKKRIIQ